MKVSDWGGMWPGQFSIAADDGSVTLEVGQRGKLEVSCEYTEYYEMGGSNDQMACHDVEPEMLAEALRLMGWTVTPPAPTQQQQLSKKEGR